MDELELAGAAAAAIASAGAIYYYFKGKTVREDATVEDYKPGPPTWVPSRVPAVKPAALSRAEGTAYAVNLPDGTTGTVVIRADGSFATNFDPSILDGNDHILKP